MDVLKKVYDVSVVGIPKAAGEFQMLEKVIERTRKTKELLVRQLDGAKEQASIAKLNAEITKQSLLEERLAQQKIKTEQELIRLTLLRAKAENQAAEAAKKSKDSNVAMSSNVGSDGKLIEPGEIKNITTAVTELEQAQLDAQLSAQEWAKSNTKATEAVKGNSAVVRDNTKLVAEEKYILSQKTRELKNQVREELNAKGSLEQRRAALIRLQIAYDRLSPRERDTSWGRRMQQVIFGLTTQIKQLETVTGRDQRNVGNYASAWDKVTEKAGKAYGVLRWVANILPGFGISGLIGAGVEGLLAMAIAMNILNTATEEEKQALKEMVEQQEKMVSQIAQERTELTVLYDTATNTNASYYERGKAVDELIKKYPDYFDNAEREKLLNGELKSTYDALTDSIKERALATAQQSKLTKLYDDLGKMQLRLDELTKGSNKENFYYSKESIEDLKEKIAWKEKEIDQLRKSMNASAQSNRQDIFFIDEKTKREYEASQAKAKNEAVLGKEEIERRKRDAEKRKREEEQRSKEEERLQAERERILFEARMSLLSDHAEEIARRTARFEEERKKLKGASNAEMKVLEEAYYNDLLNINKKYETLQRDALNKLLDDQDEFFEKYIEDLKKGNERRGKEQNEQKEFTQKNWDSIAEYTLKRQKELDRELEESVKNRNRLFKESWDKALDLAAQYFASQAQLQNQEVENNYQSVLDFNEKEKQKRLALAQSKAEEQAIEEEYEQKKKEADRKRNNERREIARKQLEIEFAIASMRALSSGMESGGYAGAIIAQAYALGQYLIALNNLNSQQFAKGGMVPTDRGGDIYGPSHSGGGVPFNFNAEGKELAIINKNSSMDSGKYNVTGTPRQIASAINAVGGGVSFAPGARVQKYEYGGMLGSNLTAPIFRGYYSNSSNGQADYSDMFGAMINMVSATNDRIDRLTVELPLSTLKKEQDRSAKKVSVGKV